MFWNIVREEWLKFISHLNYVLKGGQLLFCIKCGSDLEEGDNFCKACGKKVTVKSEPSVENITQEKNEEHLLRLFIGEKKQDYYLQKWTKGKNSWNWAAFFLSFFWLGYRKMYKYIFLFLGIFLIIDLAISIFGIDDTVLNNVIGIAVAVTLGISGNNLYRQHALKKIRESMEMNNNDNDILQEEIKIRGGGSWLGVLVAVGLLIVYLLIALVIFTFIPTFNDHSETKNVDSTIQQIATTEKKQTDIEVEIIDLIEKNVQALEDENLDDYMLMVYIDDDQSSYIQTEQMVRDLINSYDLSYEISVDEFLSISDQEVKVRVTQTTTLIEGEDFRDNKASVVHTLRWQNDGWKFFGSEIDEVTYVEEEQMQQAFTTNIYNYITLEAPEMFDFLVSEEIDINNDGTLETVNLIGGPEESNSNMNENVEITIDFEELSIPITLLAESAPILYIYDIDQDGWMELFYETGNRVKTIEMYRFSDEGLNHHSTINGKLVELTPFEVVTDKEIYTFNEIAE